MEFGLTETLTGLFTIGLPMVLMGRLVFGRNRPVWLLWLGLTALTLAYLGVTHVMTDVGAAVLEATGYATEKPTIPPELL